MEKKILVTVGDNNRIMAFTTPDQLIALDFAPVYNDAAVLARAILKPGSQYDAGASVVSVASVNL